MLLKLDKILYTILLFTKQNCSPNLSPTGYVVFDRAYKLWISFPLLKALKA